MLSVFAKLFSEPGREKELIMFIQDLAAKRLAEIGDPEDFLQLAMWHEESRIKAKWREAGNDEAQIDHLMKHQEMTPEQAFKNLQAAVITGIGLGSAFPELTERLWKVVYERSINQDEWQKWRNWGLDIGDELPEPLPLAMRQEQLLTLVRLFVCNFRPEQLSQFENAPPAEPCGPE